MKMVGSGVRYTGSVALKGQCVRGGEQYTWGLCWKEGRLRHLGGGNDSKCARHFRCVSGNVTSSEKMPASLMSRARWF